MVKVGFFVLGLILSLGSSAHASSAMSLTDEIKKVLTTEFSAPISGQVTRARVRSFYQSKNYQPLWVNNQGWTEKARATIRFMESSSHEGLNPEDYKLSSLTPQDSLEAKAKAEVRMTAVTMTCCIDLSEGRPELLQIDAKNFVQPKGTNPASLLENGLKSPDINYWLSSLSPSSRAYQLLKSKLIEYKAIADRHPSWPEIAIAGRKLVRGISDPRVSSIREKLIAWGDMKPSYRQTGNRFDSDLQDALKRFQYRHGLNQDGWAGPKTIEELNVSPRGRVRQMLVNMERLRWAPDHRTGKYVIVNIAGYELKAFEGEQEALRMKAIVGKPYRKTPIFTSNIDEVVLNPKWNVPVSIAGRDILAELQKDREHLDKHGFDLYSGWGPGAVKLDPQSINWNNVSATNFPYKLVQRPGTSNALGTIKFDFPNPYSVYVHGTPWQSLFDKDERAFSSGCIRIERTVDLADFILQGEGDWPRAKIIKEADGSETKRIKLKNRVPIYVVYYTGWVDTDGLVHFRDDVYYRDNAILTRLGI